MRPQRATNSKKLLEEIERLRLSDEIDEFTFARLEREIDKLLKVEPLISYTLNGILAGLRCDLSSIHKNFQTALNLAIMKEDKATVLDNYATSMWINGYFSEASKLGMESYENFPSLHFAQQNILRLGAVGLFHQATNLIRKRPPNEQDNDKRRFFFEVEQFMDQQDVSDESLQQLIEMAIAVLHKHKFFNFRDHDGATQMELVGDESDLCFCYTIKVKGSMAEVIDLNYELAREIAKSGLPTSLTLNFVPMYEVA